MISEYHKIRTGHQDVLTDNLERAIIHFFPDSIHSVDTDGNIVFVNEAAVALFGYTAEELVGAHLSTIYSPEVLEYVDAGFENLKRVGSCSVHSRIQHKSGKSIPVELRSFCIYHEDGTFEKTITLTRDLRNYMYAVCRNTTDTGWEIQWASEPGATYTIEWGENLESEFLVVNTGIEDEAPINSYVDYFDRPSPGIYRIMKES
jgi:PAS domain S-box-containing protein